MMVSANKKDPGMHQGRKDKRKKVKIKITSFNFIATSFNISEILISF
jgi:hypothetical protein